jgi:hypothetical protein
MQRKFTQQKDNESEPIFQAGCVAHEQSLKSVQLSIHLLNDKPSPVEFRVERGVIVRLLIRGEVVGH